MNRTLFNYYNYAAMNQSTYAFEVEELPQYADHLKQIKQELFKQELRRRIQKLHDSPVLPLP